MGEHQEAERRELVLGSRDGERALGSIGERESLCEALLCFAASCGHGLEAPGREVRAWAGGPGASQIPAGILGRAGTLLGSLDQGRSHTLPVGPAACGYQPDRCPSLHPRIPIPNQRGCGSRFTKEGIYWVEKPAKILGL